VLHPDWLGLPLVETVIVTDWATLRVSNEELESAGLRWNAAGTRLLPRKNADLLTDLANLYSRDEV
jgi:hypothetical protein